MSTDAEWLRTWFDEHEQGSGRPESEADSGADHGDADGDADDAWRHGARPARRRRFASLPVLAAAVVAVLAAGALTSTLTRRSEAPRLSVEKGSAPQTATAAGATPPPGGARAAHSPPDAAAVAELAVHEHVTTSDGLRWVDAARTVALAGGRGAADVVALVDALVLDGAPLDGTADPAAPRSEPEWIGRRLARYAVPLLCESSCEAAATPWPVPAAPAGSDSATTPAPTAEAALSAAGYRDARIEAATAVADGVEQLTVVARPPGVDAAERIVLWTGSDERGTEVVGMP